MMLVEESSPQHLPVDVEELVKALQQNSTRKICKQDLIMCILYALMKECDLHVCQSELSNIMDTNIYSLIPKLWKNNYTHHYNLSFVLGQFIKNRCRFIGIPSKDSLIVNVVICGLPKQCYSMSILCKDYVVTDEVDCNSIASIFSNLRELSFKFKNSVAHPVRSAVLNEEGILNASLLGIPYELQIKILKYLSIKELAQLAQASKYLNYLSKDQRLWKGKAYEIIREGEKPIIQTLALRGDENTDWKQICKEVLKRRSELFRLREKRISRHLFMCY